MLRQDHKLAVFVNEEKRVWEPTQKLTWLGFVWDIGNSKLELKKLIRRKNSTL